MDATALSNSLFVNNLSVVPKQFEVKSTAGDKQQQKCSITEVDPDMSGPAESVQQPSPSLGEVENEDVEFQDVLKDRSQSQEQVLAEGEQRGDESDNLMSEEAEKYASAKPIGTVAAVSSELAELTVAAEMSQVQAANPALAALTYLSDVKIADNQAAGEAISAVVENMLNRQNSGVAAGAAVDEVAVGTKGVLEKVPQTDLSSADGQAVEVQQAVETAEAIGQDVPEQKEQKVTQETVSGQSVKGATQLSVGSETETVEPEPRQVGAVVLNRDIAAEVKTTVQDNAAPNGAPQQSVAEQAASETAGGEQTVNAQVRSSTDKGTSKDQAGGSAFFRQNDIEPRCIGVINTNTTPDGVEAGRGSEVSRTLQPNQGETAKTVFDNVGEQIQTSISNSIRDGQSEVTIRLNPPELGKVVIKLQQQDGEVTGLLDFSKAETKAQIQQLLPQLVRNLQDAGIVVKRLDVVQTQIDNSAYQQFKEHVAQEGPAYQQQFSQGQSGNVGLSYDWASGESIYSGVESLNQSYISDQAVNVLV
jgi:flagellar hook-length control protein FliK